MTLYIYRDVACADGAALVAEGVKRILDHGFTYVSHSTGTGGARTTTPPTSGGNFDAAGLATALRTGTLSYVGWSRGTRKWFLQRASTANPDYTAWKYSYTATGALTPGNATTADVHATDTQYASGNTFRVLAPSSGGVAEPMKAHIIIDDATATFAVLARRTPFPGGNAGFFGGFFADEVANPVWAANPDPVICGFPCAGANTSDAQLVAAVYNNAWLGYGISGATWTLCALENPGLVAGSTTADKSGIDKSFAARWVFTGSGNGVIGTSRLFELLQPGRTPVVGLDGGTDFSRAAFWTATVPNDGVALVS